MAVQIYKKQCYVETGDNINRLLVWALFGITWVVKLFFTCFKTFCYRTPVWCCTLDNICFDISFEDLHGRAKS